MNNLVIFKHGVYPVEGNSPSAWIWTSEQFLIQVNPCVKKLTFLCYTNSGRSSKLRIQCGNSLRSVEIENKESLIEIDCKTDKLIFFVCDSFVPSEVSEDSSDNRRLGVMIKDVRIEIDFSASIPLESIGRCDISPLLSQDPLDISDFSYFCITLRTTPERKSYILDHLSKNKLKCKFFYGLDSVDLSVTSDIIKKQKFTKYGEWVTQGAIGCFISHYMFWQNVKNFSMTDKFVVFEDDVVLPENFTRMFGSYLKFVPDNWDIIYLGHESMDSCNPIKINDFVYKCIPACTFAYAIRSNKVLDILLDTLRPIRYPIDTQMILDLSSKVNSYCLFPSLVYQKSSNESQNFFKSMTYDWKLDYKNIQ